MKFRNAYLTATVLAAPLALPHFAKAQPVSGLYVAGGIGYNQEQKSKETNFTASGQEAPAQKA